MRINFNRQCKYNPRRQRVLGAEKSQNIQLSRQFVDFVRSIRELVEFKRGETDAHGLTLETYTKTGTNDSTYKIEVITYNDTPEHHRIDVIDKDGANRYAFVDISSVDYERTRQLHAGGHQGIFTRGINEDELNKFIKEVREQIITPNPTPSE